MTSPQLPVRVKKYGIRLNPPAIVVFYVNLAGKIHKRTMPVRNLTKHSDSLRIAEELRDRHKGCLESMSTVRVHKLVRILQEHATKGDALDECIRVVAGEFALDPEQDLNKLDDKILEVKKNVMNETFEMNRVKPDDPEFKYDVSIEFPEVGGIEASSDWDSDALEF